MGQARACRWALQSGYTARDPSRRGHRDPVVLANVFERSKKGKTFKGLQQ